MSLTFSYTTSIILDSVRNKKLLGIFRATYLFFRMNLYEKVSEKRLSAVCYFVIPGKCCKEISSEVNM